MPTRLRELWRYRDLLRMLIIRDLKTRYKGSFFGYLWTLLNPLLMCGIFYFVFSTFARFDRPHYALELLLGILLWNIIADSVNTSIYSIIGNASLIKKVYLPLEIFPLSVVAGVTVNFICALPVLVIFCLVQGVYPTLDWLWALPISVAVCVLLATGLSLIVSVLAVRFKDTNHFVPVLLQLGFFASPVLYPLSAALQHLPGAAGFFYLLNPYATWVTNARDVVVDHCAELSLPGLSDEVFPAIIPGILYGIPITLLVLVSGWLIFSSQRRRLAEYL